MNAHRTSKGLSRAHPPTRRDCSALRLALSPPSDAPSAPRRRHPSPYFGPACSPCAPGGGARGARSLSIRTAWREACTRARGSRGACARAGRGLTKSHAPHRDREIVGRPPHTHLYEASTPTRRCAVGWGGVGEGQGRTPGSRRRSREDEGTQYHMRFRSPLLSLHPSSARSPGAAPHPRPRSSGPSVHPAPTAAGECTALARRLPSRTHVQHAPSRAPKSRPRPAPPAPCPCPAPPWRPRKIHSYQDLCRADTPWRYLALTEASPTAPPSHRAPLPQPRTALPTEESFF